MFAEEAQDPIRQHVQMRTECHQFKSAASEGFSGGGLPLPLELCRWLGTGLSFVGLEGSGCPRPGERVRTRHDHSARSAWPGIRNRASVRRGQDINPLIRHMTCKSPVPAIGCLFTLVSFDAQKSGVVHFVYICFCCLCFWCHTQEVIDKSNVMKFSSYVFLQELCSFRS